MGAAARMTTVAEALAAAVEALAGVGVREPRADAEVLLAAALGTSRAGVIASARRPLPAAAGTTFAALVARRQAREPLQYVTGRQEFWSLDLAVDRRVLVPRPETEVVVATALGVAPGARRVLDVGTGSGAIAAALARELPAARVWASDRSAAALAVAAANLRRLAPGVGLVAADLLAAFRPGAFDLVVANPPYVADAELAGLDPEIRDHEPRPALAGGPDGLAVVRALAAGAAAALAPGGWLVIEIGAGQAARARAAMEEGGFDDVTVVRDPGGIERVLAARVRGGRRP
jgi:release factor glutamine methyltransferase